MKIEDLLADAQHKVKYLEGNKASCEQSLEDQIAQFKLARAELEDEIRYVDNKVRNIRYLIGEIECLDEAEVPKEVMDQLREFHVKLSAAADSLENSTADAALLIDLRL